MMSNDGGQAAISAVTPVAVSTVSNRSARLIPSAAASPPRQPMDSPWLMTKAMFGPGDSSNRVTAPAKMTSVCISSIAHPLG
ncbi:hypothetical protein D3C76_1538910 [compost metagenome]